MITINLLPWREEARQAKKIRAGLIALGFILFAVIALLSVYVYLSILIGHQQARNDYLQSVVESETRQVSALKTRKKQVMDVESEIAFIVSLREISNQAITLLSALPKITPDSVTLTKITKAGSDVTFFGKSKSNIQVTYFMQHLAKMPFFKQQDLIEISENKEAGTEARYFQLKMQERD